MKRAESLDRRCGAASDSHIMGPHIRVLSVLHIRVTSDCQVEVTSDCHIRGALSRIAAVGRDPT